MRRDLVTLGVLPAFPRHFHQLLVLLPSLFSAKGTRAVAQSSNHGGVGGGVRRIQRELGAAGWEGGRLRGEGVVCVRGARQVGGRDVPHEERTVFATRLRPTPLLGPGLGWLPQLPAASGIGLDGETKVSGVLRARCWYCFLSSFTFANCGSLESGVFSFAPDLNLGTAVAVLCVPCVLGVSRFPRHMPRICHLFTSKSVGSASKLGCLVSVWHRKVFPSL